MSLDLTQYIDAGGPEPIEIGGAWFNYTSNVNPMWRMLFDGSSLGQVMQGKKGSDVIPILTAGVEAMAAEPERYKALNPPNGWGDYDSALLFLRNVLAACQAAPVADWRASW